MANSRYYSSIALPTTLTGGVTNSGTSIAVASTSGFPGSLPYILALDYGAASEELVLVTNVAALTLTVTRAYDGTAGTSHNTGAVVRHVSSAIDFTDSRTHEASSTGVHGVSGAVVGTSDSQTLTNKNLTLATGSLKNISMFNQGASGITQIIGDSTNPTASRLEIKDNESALNTMLFVQSTGNIKSVKNVSDTDTTYKVRLTDNDGTTDRFAVLAGGTVTVTPTGTTTSVPVDLIMSGATGAKRVLRVAAAAGATERFTVFDDGRLAIVAQAAAQNALKVTAAPSPSADIVNVSDSTGSNTLFAIQSTGKFLGNKGGTIAQPGVTSGVVLQVGGSNVGYTGNLQQWVSPGNAIVAQVTEAGNASFNQVSAATTAFTTYTPTITNGGSATFTTNSGYFYKLGKLVYLNINVVVNVAGSGALNVAITAPSSMDGSQDQNLLATFQSGSTRVGNAIKFTGASSATFDRIRVQDGGAADVTANLTGAQLTAGSVLDIQGWYREA